VYLALTEEDFRKHSDEGRCIAVPVVRQEQAARESEEGMDFLVGNAFPPYVDNFCRIDVTEFRLSLEKKLQWTQTPQLRGFFGRTFAEEVSLHQHRPDGSVIYDYPRVQYKILDRTPVLLGLGNGSDLLTRLWLEVDRTKIGMDELLVLESSIVRRTDQLGEMTEPAKYRFLTPWLALNQENERRYAIAQSLKERVALLESILVGNCLSLAKAFGHRVTARLQANCGRLRPVRSSLKGMSMTGFVGAFQVNFSLPDRIGIGKSVSRGFGTVERFSATSFR
jgi:hypothetical protein